MYINTSWRSNRRKMNDDVKNKIFGSYQEKFMALLVKPSEDECWYLDIGGEKDPLEKYCAFGWRATKDEKSKTFMARRVAYEIFYGKDTEDLVIGSTCKKPGCVNPKHLLAGTKSETLKLKYKDEKSDKK